MPRIFGEINEDRTALKFKVEDVWKRVRRWARRNGHEMNWSYGVVGVAPT